MSLEVDDPNTWPAQLEAKLQEDGDFLARQGVARVEVINAGVGGWRSREGLLRLRQEVRGLAPDMILVAFNWNDVIAGLDGEDPDSAISAELPWWAHSILLQNLRVRYLVHKSNDEALYKSWIAGLRRDQPWAKAFEQNLLAMQAIARDIKAEMVLVNLPGLCRKESRDSGEYEMIIRKTRVTPASFDFYVSLKGFISDFLYDIGRGHGMTVSDVSSYFENFSDSQRLALFTDEMHASTAGSAEIAEAVYLCLAREACRATLRESPRSFGYQEARS
jgi:lysophospholipase L1-like esterase